MYFLQFISGSRNMLRALAVTCSLIYVLNG